VSATEITSVSSEFDILAHWPIQTPVLDTIEVVYKHIDPVDQNDLEFFLSYDKDTYIALDIKLYQETHDQRHRCCSDRFLERALLFRHGRYAAYRSVGRESDRHGEPGIHHSLSQI